MQSMSSAASQLFTQWQAPRQMYVSGQAEAELEQAAEQLRQETSKENSVLVKAGSIIYAVLDTSINTDEPGPVMASVVAGRLKGSKLMGRITTTPTGERVLLSFDNLVLPNKAQTISVSAVAIDPDTSRTTFSNYTNTHFFMRYGMLLASSFLSGYGQAVQQSGTSITQNLTTGTSITQQLNLSARQQKQVALGKAANSIGQKAAPLFNTPPTVKVNAGIGLGILFMTNVNDASS